jgi:hypothetical protein
MRRVQKISYLQLCYFSYEFHSAKELPSVKKTNRSDLKRSLYTFDQFDNLIYITIHFPQNLIYLLENN